MKKFKLVCALAAFLFGSLVSGYSQAASAKIIIVAAVLVAVVAYVTDWPTSFWITILSTLAFIIVEVSQGKWRRLSSMVELKQS